MKTNRSYQSKITHNILFEGYLTLQPFGKHPNSNLNRLKSIITEKFKVQIEGTSQELLLSQFSLSLQNRVTFFVRSSMKFWISLLNHEPLPHIKREDKPRVVFILGGPGKGIQSQLIQERYQLHHMSAGNLLREERKNEHSQHGKLLDQYMVGKIVPCEITVKLLEAEMFRKVLRIYIESNQLLVQQVIIEQEFDFRHLFQRNFEEYQYQVQSNQLQQVNKQQDHRTKYNGVMDKEDIKNSKETQEKKEFFGQNLPTGELELGEEHQQVPIGLVKYQVPMGVTENQLQQSFKDKTETMNDVTENQERWEEQQDVPEMDVADNQEELEVLFDEAVAENPEVLEDELDSDDSIIVENPPLEIPRWRRNLTIDVNAEQIPMRSFGRLQQGERMRSIEEGTNPREFPSQE